MRDRLLVATMQAALYTAQQSVDTIRSILNATTTRGGSTDVFDETVVSTAIRTVPRWHFSMLNDFERNNAFATALERALPRGAHVLDIGSGTGLLAMMAAKAGAASVTSCEQSPMLAEMATQIVAQHGLSDVITVVAKRSDQLVVGVDLPRRADVIVSEIVDCGLIGEGVLPTVAHAREHLLAPGGTLLPESARVFGALLDSAAVDGLNRVQYAGGFNVGLLNGLATPGHFPVRLPTWPHRMVSETHQLCAFDFVSGPMGDGANAVEMAATETGTAHGLAVWFELSLGGGVVLRNSPDNAASHWMQAFVPFDEPITVTEGDHVLINFRWQRGRLSAREVNFSNQAEGQK